MHVCKILEYLITLASQHWQRDDFPTRGLQATEENVIWVKDTGWVPINQFLALQKYLSSKHLSGKVRRICRGTHRSSLTKARRSWGSQLCCPFYTGGLDPLFMLKQPKAGGGCCRGPRLWWLIMYKCRSRFIRFLVILALQGGAGARRCSQREAAMWHGSVCRTLCGVCGKPWLGRGRDQHDATEMECCW